MDQGVILVGGKGTRLGTLTRDVPKPLLPVLGRPFLEYVLDRIATTGVAEVILLAGYLGDQLAARYHGTTVAGVKVRCVVEPKPLGTAGALAFARDRGSLTADRVVICNGDSLMDANLADFSRAAQGRPSAGTIVVNNVADTSRFGTVRMAGDGAVIGFEEKRGEAISGWINTGIYSLPSSLLDSIPLRESLSLEQQMFPSWLDGRLYGWPIDAPFIDIGLPESLACADAFIADGRDI